jgi:hypothetical protein
MTTAVTKFINDKLSNGELVPTTHPTTDGRVVFAQPFPAIIGKDGRVQPDLLSIPIRLGKYDAARFISQFFFPVSGRTLERWKLRKQLASGRAVYLTADLVDHCKIKLASAPSAGTSPRK